MVLTDTHFSNGACCIGASRWSAYPVAVRVTYDNIMHSALVRDSKGWRLLTALCRAAHGFIVGGTDSRARLFVREVRIVVLCFAAPIILSREGIDDATIQVSEIPVQDTNN